MLDSSSAELLAVTGRRRVGKTYLIDNFYGDRFCFSMTGIQNQGSHEQLVNFAVRLAQYDATGEPRVPETWQWAFVRLREFLETLDPTRKRVLFFDELPWIAASDRSFVQMLAHFWNDYLSKQPHFVLVICGSATAWITQRILNDPGGMHNRVTRHLHVQPFTLGETRDYLEHRRIDLTETDLARTYMAIGGTPYYLNGFERADSFVTAIDRMCFSPTGLLQREYGNLFAALFRNADTHEAIVAALAKYPGGLARTALTKATGLKSQSMIARALEELSASDFITYSLAHGGKKRGARYRLVDEFSLFYHRFMAPMRDSPGEGRWMQIADSQTYRSWAGTAFELLCQKHTSALTHVLGISGLRLWSGPLFIPPTEDHDGAQIDLLLDRPDATVNLCEMKFYAEPFTLTKGEATELLRKKQLVRSHFRGRKRVQITLVTNYPPVENKWLREVVDGVVTLGELIAEL
jgi:hypothetical protein